MTLVYYPPAKNSLLKLYNFKYTKKGENSLNQKKKKKVFVCKGFEPRKRHY